MANQYRITTIRSYNISLPDEVTEDQVWQLADTLARNKKLDGYRTYEQERTVEVEREIKLEGDAYTDFSTDRVKQILEGIR